MSSPEFSASLDPSCSTRRFLLGSGVVLNAAGSAALLTLAVPDVVRLSLVLGWSAWGIREQVRFRRQFAVTRRFHFDVTGGLALGPNPETAMPAQVLRGTVALSRAIWLRYRHPTGRTGVELFLGSSRTEPRFRRVVVLLRLQPYQRNLQGASAPETS
jgi:hypothetical protein